MPFTGSINWRAALWAYAPVLFWIGVIFFFSSGSGSFSTTAGLIGPLLKFLFPTADDAFIQTAHGLVRKAAHVTEYAILAALAARAFLRSSEGLIRDRWALWAIGVVSLTATLDEFNQSFNIQRTGSPWDVLLDISGGVLSIALISLVRRRGVRTAPRKG